MKSLILCMVSLVAVGCGTKAIDPLAKYENKTAIVGNQDLIKTQHEICKSFKSDEFEKVVYSCGSGFSSDLNISRSKSILDSKIRLQDKLSSTISKSETNNVEDTDKNGVRKKYSSEEASRFDEVMLENYDIVYEKSFMHKSRFYTFVVIKFKHI